MTPDQYRQALADIGLSQRRAAKLLGINERTSRRYAERGVPGFASERVRQALAAKLIEQGEAG